MTTPSEADLDAKAPGTPPSRRARRRDASAVRGRVREGREAASDPRRGLCVSCCYDIMQDCRRSRASLLAQCRSNLSRSERRRLFAERQWESSGDRNARLKPCQSSVRRPRDRRRKRGGNSRAFRSRRPAPTRIRSAMSLSLKREIVAAGGLREEKKRPFRCHAFVADLAQAAEQPIAIRLISGDIDRGIQRAAATRCIVAGALTNPSVRRQKQSPSSTSANCGNSG